MFSFNNKQGIAAKDFNYVYIIYSGKFFTPVFLCTQKNFKMRTTKRLVESTKR